MIHLEDVQPAGSERIAVGKRIQSGAQHHVLANAAFEGLGKLILGVPAAYREERAQRSREGLLGIGWLFRFAARNRHGQRIFEDPRLVDKLMRRTPHGDTLRGPAGLSAPHNFI